LEGFIMTKITINGVTLDPDQDAPSLKNFALLSTDAASSDYILLQTRAPLTPAQKAELRQAGAMPLEHVPEDTYICEYKGTDLDKLRALPFVAWAHIYLEGFKIAPELHAAAQAPQANLLSLLGMASTPGSGKKRVNIVLHRGVAADDAAPKIAAAAGLNPADIKPKNGTVTISVDADRLKALSRIDAVRHIEAVHQKTLWNDIARGILGVDTVKSSAGFQGAGQIVAVCDTGFDTGNVAQPHPAFEGRIKSLYGLGRAGDPSDPDGHGTHVCGSVLGDGHSAVYGQLRGTAPAATLVMQSVLAADGSLGGLDEGLSSILQQAYDDGARVHSNSWGDTNNHYTADSHDVDRFVWEHRDAVIVFAAGNAGRDGNKDGIIDSHSLGSPGTAKNCITVGASENHRPNFSYVDGASKFRRYGEGWPSAFPASPVSHDRLADNPDGLAAFSARGPTSDGRVKPDVVAPGTAILSTRSRAHGVGNGWGPSKDPLYFFEGGTSMSTPLVAGCAAVVREFLHGKQFARPSAALVKALLINGADPLRGQYTPSETGVVPNSGQGFGRVNLASAVGVGGDNKIIGFWDEDRALDTGEEQVFQLTLTAAVKLLKVTLVWTDPAGESLQNDLDLTVQTASGLVGVGNAAPGSSIPDRTNNVEQVSLQAVPSGQVTIKVRAYRCAIDPQTFALVARAYT
jgi:serine protease AprX